MFAATIIVAGCGGEAASGPTGLTTVTTAVVSSTLPETTGGRPEPDPTVSTVAPTSTSPTVAPPTTEATSTSTGPPTTAASDEVTILADGISLPVGAGGFTYSDALEDQTVDGPNALAVDRFGGIHIADPLAGQIVSVRGTDVSRIDVKALGLYWITDLVATDDYLIVLESYLAGPEVQRVNVISYEGALLAQADIDLEYDRIGWLWGLVDTGDGRWVLDFPDFDREWNPDTQQFEVIAVLDVRGSEIELLDHDIRIDDVILPADATPNNVHWSSMRYLGSTDDGRWIIERWDGTETVEWWTHDGTFIGAAEVPLGGTVDAKENLLATTPDGRAFVLFTRPDSVDVIELMPQPERIITP